MRRRVHGHLEQYTLLHSYFGARVPKLGCINTKKMGAFIGVLSQAEQGAQNKDTDKSKLYTMPLREAGDRIVAHADTSLFDFGFVLLSLLDPSVGTRPTT